MKGEGEKECKTLNYFRVRVKEINGQKLIGNRYYAAILETSSLVSVILIFGSGLDVPVISL